MLKAIENCPKKVRKPYSYLKNRIKLFLKKLLSDIEISIYLQVAFTL